MSMWKIAAGVVGAVVGIAAARATIRSRPEETSTEIVNTYARLASIGSPTEIIVNNVICPDRHPTVAVFAELGASLGASLNEAEIEHSDDEFVYHSGQIQMGADRAAVTAARDTRQPYVMIAAADARNWMVLFVRVTGVGKSDIPGLIDRALQDVAVQSRTSSWIVKALTVDGVRQAYCTIVMEALGRAPAPKAT